MKTRALFRTLLVVLLGIALTAPLAGTASAERRGPDRIELPDGFQPEGITIGPGPIAYFGSRADGDIYAADLRNGRGSLISQGPGTASVGLKSDRRGLLYVAGGSAGTGRVVSARTGAILASYQFTDSSDTFVNDVVLVRRTAWFTDSRQAQLYAVPMTRKGRIPDPTRFRRVPLGGQWEQAAGVNNANGIAPSPDRRSLLVVQSNTGKLFRVDPRSGYARQVDLGTTVLTNGDGLLLRGRTLYVVQNRLNQVAVIKLDRRGNRGMLVDTLSSRDFDVPTTVAARGNSLYLPNARFTTPATPTTPYWVTRIPAR